MQMQRTSRTVGYIRGKKRELLDPNINELKNKKRKGNDYREKKINRIIWKFLKIERKIELKNQVDRERTQARLCNYTLPEKWKTIYLEIPMNADESEGFAVIVGFM